MPTVRTRTALKGLLVKEAMQRRVLRAPQGASLARGINQLIKYKHNGLLVVDSTEYPVGVVSKTDLVGAFYGGLPVDSPLREIMNGPVLTCFPDDEVEERLDLMRANSVHHLYVLGAEPSSIVGMLSYSDVAALLYSFCRKCKKSMQHGNAHSSHLSPASALTVQEVMQKSVVSLDEGDSLARVIEELIMHQLGAVLVRDGAGLPCGVISKTDIIIAYNHGTGLEVPAHSVMQTPVAACDKSLSLTEALRHMFLNDVQRIFVYADDPANIVGVLSFSDAAQVRSGSCRACATSRIITSP